MYNIYSFPTERLSSEIVFTWIQALSIFSDVLQLKGWGGGKNQRSFSDFKWDSLYYMVV